jgi:hypothetical protein
MRFVALTLWPKLLYESRALPLSLKDINPYRIDAGPELDAAIHQFVFGQADNGARPRYSLERNEAEKVAARLKADYGLGVVTGRTRLASKPWFARYENDPSTSTEVIAETESLAICRLALVRISRDAE